MPVHHGLPKDGMIYQREQYAKGGVGRWYWDYKDNVAFSCILPHHQTILDLGCGEGVGLEKLTLRFPAKMVMGIDLEPENVEICLRHNLRALRSSIYELPFGNSTVDACICIDVLEHLERPVEALEEARRVLSTAGRLIIIVPHDRNFLLARLAFGMVKEAFYDSGHVKQWRPGELSRLLQSEGFRVIARRNLPFLFWQSSLHHMVVAERM
jgi:SAM-dependent methyltransferase